MPKTRQWTKPLPNQVKAEVLGSVFHLLTSHEPEAMKCVPEWLQKQMRQAMYDCAVDFRDLSKGDIAQLREYMDWLEKKHPRTKPKSLKK